MKITIVNNYYPPNKSVIAESASDLAMQLELDGFKVHIVHDDSDYAGGGAQGTQVGICHPIKSVYSGKNKFIRLFSSQIEGRRLIKKAKEVNSDVTIVMTSPPLLNYWAGSLFSKSGHKWIYWTMDIYPEGFNSAGLISENNPIFKYFLKKSYQSPPNGLIALGEIQAKYLEEKFDKKLPKAILPCGIFLHQNKSQKSNNSTPSWKTEPNKIYFGYIGNLGEAHSVEFVKEMIDAIDPDKHHLILVVYGSKAHIIKDYLHDKTQGITLLNYVPREDLKYIDVHLTSLKANWVNICVPSKMLSAVHQGSVFLFCGVEDCDSWQYLSEAGWLIQDNAEIKDQIQSFLKSVNHEMIASKRENCKELPSTLYDNTVNAYRRIRELVNEIQYTA